MAGSIQSFGDCVRALVGDTDEWLVVTADDGCPGAIVEALHGRDDAPDAHVDLLATADVCRRLDDDFPVASRARDLDVDGALSIRTLPEGEAPPTLFVSATGATVIVPLGGGEVTTASLAGEATDRLRDRYRATWDGAMPHTVDAPPYSRLVAQIGDALGDDARDDFETGLAAVGARGPKDRLGPVEVALLVAATREKELRSVVDWATATDLASQGTVSRAKKRLEEVGLVDTEPVNVGVGRPRQKLVLPEETSGSLSIEGLIDAAVGVV